MKHFLMASVLGQQQHIKSGNKEHQEQSARLLVADPPVRHPPVNRNRRMGPIPDRVIIRARGKSCDRLMPTAHHQQQPIYDDGGFAQWDVRQHRSMTVIHQHTGVRNRPEGVTDLVVHARPVFSNNQTDDLRRVANWAFVGHTRQSEFLLQNQNDGPQSLDSSQREQFEPSKQYPASVLSRKVSTYGTLPRNRQHLLAARYRSKS